jgi:hypothetical protein
MEKRKPEHKHDWINRLAAIVSGLIIIESAILLHVNGILYFLGGGLIVGGAKIAAPKILSKLHKEP